MYSWHLILEGEVIILNSKPGLCDYFRTTSSYTTQPWFHWNWTQRTFQNLRDFFKHFTHEVKYLQGFFGPEFNWNSVNLSGPEPKFEPMVNWNSPIESPWASSPRIFFYASQVAGSQRKCHANDAPNVTSLVKMEPNVVSRKNLGWVAITYQIKCVFEIMKPGFECTYSITISWNLHSPWWMILYGTNFTYVKRCQKLDLPECETLVILLFLVFVKVWLAVTLLKMVFKDVFHEVFEGFDQISTHRGSSFTPQEAHQQMVCSFGHWPGELLWAWWKICDNPS